MRHQDFLAVPSPHYLPLKTSRVRFSTKHFSYGFADTRREAVLFCFVPASKQREKGSALFRCWKNRVRRAPLRRSANALVLQLRLGRRPHLLNRSDRKSQACGLVRQWLWSTG